MLSVGFLGEVDGESTVLVGGLLKVGAKEPVYRAHELDLDLGSEEALEVALD